MTWLDRWSWPREAISDLQRDVFQMRLAVLTLPARLAKIEAAIARLDKPAPPGEAGP